MIPKREIGVMIPEMKAERKGRKQKEKKIRKRDRESANEGE